MDTDTSTKQSTNQGLLVQYVTGFILSIALTLAAYSLVVQRTLPVRWIIISIVGLAVAQLFVQLFFFLHMGNERKPRWNLMAFLFMVMVVVIVAFGSLWIMNNLDYNMMPAGEMERYMHEQNEKGF